MIQASHLRQCVHTIFIKLIVIIMLKGGGGGVVGRGLASEANFFVYVLLSFC